MDLELQSMESDSSDQQIDIFSRLDMEPEELRFTKRVRKAILTFTAQHYLRIIITMAIFIILLVCGIIISIIQRNNFPIAVSEEARLKNQQPKTTIEASGVTDNRKPSTPSTTLVTMGRKQDYSVNEAVNVLNGTTIEMIPCRKFNCGKIPDPCILTSIDYKNIKQYSCCGCLGIYRLIRYQEFSVAQTTSMILAGSAQDPCLLSPLDLQILKHPENLEGEWDIDRETESLCYLKFDISGISQRQLIESPLESVETSLEH